MGFLLPVALLFGLVVPIIVLLYFLKLRRPERRVSSTFLWRRALRDLEANAPWQRLRVNLLLILQLIALAATVLALARPYYLTAGGVRGDVIVLLQASASMRATDVPPSRFGAAKAAVRELIDRLEPSAAMTIIALAEVPRVLVARGEDRAVLRAALDAAQPTAGPADLSAALSLAASLARDRPNLHAVLVGDGLVEADPPGELPFPLRYVQIGTAGDNLAIAAFASGPLDDGDGRRQGALATVANYGPNARQTALELYADGRLGDVRRLDLAPGEERHFVWPALPAGARVLRLHLASGDAFALDDDAWALVAPAARARVLLAGPGNVFLERALRLSPAIELAKTTPEGYAPGGYDLYVFDRFLPATLPGGGILVVGPPGGDAPFAVGAVEPVRAVAAESVDDELLRYVDLAGVHVAKARRIEAPEWARAVLGAPADPAPLPLLVAGEERGRRLAVLSFDLHDSDLPLQPAFPILVQNLLAYLAPDAAAAGRALRVGEPIPVHLRPSARSAAVVRPDGRPVPVAPPFPPASFADTAEPGIYTLVQQGMADTASEAGESESLFAVNFFSPGQSRLAPAALSLAGHAAASDSLSDLVPRELWRLGVALALLALGAEWWLYHRG